MFSSFPNLFKSLALNSLRFNPLSNNFQGIIKNVDKLSIDQLNELIDLPYELYPDLADDINIVWDGDEHGISIYVNKN